MILAPAVERPRSEPNSSPEPRRRLRGSILAALLICTAAAGVRAIAAMDSDLPPLDVLLRDLREVLLPWQRGEANAWSVLLQSHDAGSRLMSVAWVGLNGQMDARISAMSGVCFGLVALAFLFRILGGPLRTVSFVMLAVASAALMASPAFSLFGTLAGAEGSATVALSLLHLALAGPARARPVRLVAGLACGLLSVLHSSAGIASALALLLWSSVETWREGEAICGSKRRMHVHAGLAILGAGLVACRVAAVGVPSWTLANVELVGWPFPHGIAALVVWAPAMACVVRWVRRRGATADRGVPLPLLALWGGLAALASLATGPLAPAILATGVLVNAACLGAAADRVVSPNSRWIALGTVWSLLLVDALFQPRLERTDLTGPSARLEPALQRALRQHDDAALRAQPGWTRERSEAALRILRDPLAGKILPASIRIPLPVAWEALPPATLVASDALAAMPGRDALPGFGTRTATGGSATGEYLSRPFRTSFPILQFRVLGELRPPATSLSLRDQLGREFRAWTEPFSASSRWRRVNFAATAEEMRIAVHDRDAAAWLAFTAPVELGRVSWLVGKLLGIWPWLFATGLIAILPAAWESVRGRKAILAGCANSGAWVTRQRLLPWMALAAYAIALSSHVDTTAGPNDSGGYLNAAKTLASGRITTVPPAPLANLASAADVAPYVPATFRATADGRMGSNYPVGFPLLVASLAQVMPLDWAAGVCLWVHLIAGVGLMRRLGRVAGLSDGWAWLGAGILGLSPVYLFHGLQPMSDVPALVWTMAAVLLAWTCDGNPWRALLAGGATAVAVLIRPTNLFCALPIVVILAGRWRSLALWIGGGLAGAVWQAWLNQTLYGGIFSSGYGDIRTMIGAEFLGPTIRAYAVWLPELFTPIVWLAPVALLLRPIPGRTRLTLLSWVVPFLLFYAFYWCTWDHWCGMRFVLPAAPVLVVMALLGLRHLLPHLRARWGRDPGDGGRVMAAALFAVLLFGWLAADSIQKRLFFWLHANQAHAVVAASVRAQAPADAIVLADHAMLSLMYYTKLTCLRVAFAPPEALAEELLGPIRRSGRPVFAVVHPSEVSGAGESGPPAGGWGLGGDWRKVASPWPGGASVWQWQPAPR